MTSTSRANLADANPDARRRRGVACGQRGGPLGSRSRSRLQQYGENALVEHHVSVLERLAHFFWGPIPWMIEIAAVLSGVLRHWDDLVDHSGRCCSSTPASASGRSSRPTTPSRF